MLIELTDLWVPLGLMLTAAVAGSAALSRNSDRRMLLATGPLTSSIGELTRSIVDTDKEAQAAAIKIVRLETELVEVETQLRMGREYDNLRWSYEQRMTGILYEEVFKKPLPTLDFPPIAPVPVRRA